jgi:hypothetical protein
MTFKDPNDTGPITDPNDLIEKSRINIKYNKESESIEEITIDSKEGEEITLFPMILDSGQEYMPNIGQYRWDQTLQDDNDTHYVFSLSLKNIDDFVYYYVAKNDFHRTLLEFAKYNLPFEEYARLIFEQREVIHHYFEAQNERKLSKEIYYRDLNQLVMYWPEYYPGKENYNSEFLPTTEELYRPYLFNKLGYVLNHRKHFDIEEMELFNLKELLYLEIFIKQNYENEPNFRYEPSEIFDKIKEFQNVNSEGISHMIIYIEQWKDLLMIPYRKENLKNYIKGIPVWRNRNLED